MMTSFFFGGRKKSKVGIVNFDAMLTENHTMSADITSHPVETGADITDHIRLMPKEVELTGVISNHPIEIAAANVAQSIIESGFSSASLNASSPLDNGAKGNDDRVDVAVAELERIMTDGELVTVVTSLKEYENMAITSMSIPRDKDRGNSAEVSISLREIVVADAERTSAPTIADTDRPKKQNIGTKPPKSATDATAEKSRSVFSSTSGIGA